MSPQPVLDMELRPKGEIATMTPESPAVMFERLARDPSMDVDKLDRLMQLHERATARWAQEQFNAAMTAAQKDMRPVAADADNPQTRSRYASYRALDLAIRPIYTAHGFGLSFNTGDSPLVEHVRVVCDVSHVGGHEKQYHVDMPADGKGAKGGDVMTKTHAVGAALSYGCRYLLKLIFNIAVGEDDRDGNTKTATTATEPAGFQDWLMAMQRMAERGTDALKKAWTEAPAAARDYLRQIDAKEIDRLKAIAAKVTAAKGGDK